MYNQRCILAALIFIAAIVINGCQRYSKSVMFSADKCPPVNSTFVTVVPGGRLGNGIFEYLSVWALAKQKGAVPVVPQEILTQISDVFVGLKIPALEVVARRCGADFLTEVNENRHLYEGNRTSRFENVHNVTVLRKYAFDWKSLLPYWEELHLQVIFHKYLLEEAQRILASLTKSSKVPIRDFVAVHVRRTDYLKYITSYQNATEARASYFLKAMKILRKRLASPPIFIVTSDDPEWCKKNLKQSSDVFVISEGRSPELDLALLASCNHTIFDYGTFGVAVAMFNWQGETVVYDTGSNDYFVTRHFADLLHNWTKLRN